MNIKKIEKNYRINYLLIALFKISRPLHPLPTNHISIVFCCSNELLIYSNSSCDCISTLINKNKLEGKQQSTLESLGQFYSRIY